MTQDNVNCKFNCPIITHSYEHLDVNAKQNMSDSLNDKFAKMGI
jgi:hypothetical protein